MGIGMSDDSGAERPRAVRSLLDATMPRALAAIGGAGADASRWVWRRASGSSASRFSPRAPSNAPRPAAAAGASRRRRAKSSIRPSRRFSLSRRADGARARYEARIDRATGARRDAYSLGALDGDGPALRVEMWRNASAARRGKPVRRNRRGGGGVRRRRREAGDVADS